jgi:hypothetical protein
MEDRMLGWRWGRMLGNGLRIGLAVKAVSAFGLDGGFFDAAGNILNHKIAFCIKH